MKQYRNSERTKRWIKRAFTELLAEKKSIDKITINELAERADVTKATFYYHYADIYAVAEEFENELIEKLNEILEEIDRKKPNDYSAYLQKGLDFIKENEEDYKLAANASDLNFFASKLKTIFTKRMVAGGQVMGFSKDYETRAVQVSFIVNAIVDTVLQYLRGSLAVSLEVVGKVVNEAIDKLKKRKRLSGRTSRQKVVKIAKKDCISI